MLQNLSESHHYSWLSWFLRGLLLLGCLVLIGRLGELQLIKGNYFRALAEGNRIRRIPIVAPRGEIKARGGENLAQNIEVKKAVLFNPEEGYEKSEDVTYATPEQIITEYRRNYPVGDIAGHLTGYLSEASADEVGKVDPNCPEKGARLMGSHIGRSGLEEQYECLLRGINGEHLVEVDSMGRPIRVLGVTPAIAGKNVETTIDIGLQRKTASGMLGKKGAAILTDGRGEIMALFSSPSYNPNLFVGNSPDAQEYLTSVDLPLFNRALSGTYHPGSIYKIVTAAAALEEGKIDESFLYNDTGVIKVGEFSYTNWYFTQYGGREGVIDLPRAIARSTDTFFYMLGELVGANTLANWSKKFGLEEKTKIDLPGEVLGLIPTPEWKKSYKGEAWFLGNTYHMAIGQGDVAITPIAANSLTSVIAANGELCDMHIEKNAPRNCRDLHLSKTTLDEIKEGMIAACATGGTAFPFFDFKPKVACKTGTAETMEKDVTHAWFTVIAPADEPDIVVTILVEKGGEGSKVAAPIAHDILKVWAARLNP